MEFDGAAEVTRRHPGSVLTRDNSGAFIVRLPDGQVIGKTASLGKHSQFDVLRKQCDEISEMILRIRSDSERRERELQAKITDLEPLLSRVSESEFARIEQDERNEEQRRRDLDRAEFLARDECAKRIIILNRQI